MDTSTGGLKKALGTPQAGRAGGYSAPRKGAPSQQKQGPKGSTAKRIRDIKRLLARVRCRPALFSPRRHAALTTRGQQEGLPATLRQEQERILASLEDTKIERQKSALEAKLVKRYRGIRFFGRSAAVVVLFFPVSTCFVRGLTRMALRAAERRKLMRHIASAEKQLAAAAAAAEKTCVVFPLGKRKASGLKSCVATLGWQAHPGQAGQADDGYELRHGGGFADFPGPGRRG